MKEEHQVVITIVRREGKNEMYRASCTCTWAGDIYKRSKKAVAQGQRHEADNN